MSDKRRGRRFAARIKVRFRSVEELVTAYTEDVSRGGLYVTASQQLPPGTEVQLALELPDGGKPALVPARVSYTLNEAEAREQNRNPGMGMEFLEEDVAPLAERIASFLAKSIGSGEFTRPEPIHALIVEDSAVARKAIAGALEAFGHRVTVAEHGLDALGKAMREPPDIVLTDVTMPVMDGWQLLKLLRARDATRNVPVIFLTALDSDVDRIRGYERGIDDFIAKPFAPDELVARVMRIVLRTRWEGQPVGGGTSMTGDLRQVALPSLLAFAEAERRSGTITIHTPSQLQARIGIREGVVASVHLPDADAPDSILERLLIVLDWEDGRFVMDQGEIDETDDSINVQLALMEHARRVDEAKR